MRINILYQLQQNVGTYVQMKHLDYPLRHLKIILINLVPNTSKRISTVPGDQSRAPIFFSVSDHLFRDRVAGSSPTLVNLGVIQIFSKIGMKRHCRLTVKNRNKKSTDR